MNWVKLIFPTNLRKWDYVMHVNKPFSNSSIRDFKIEIADGAVLCCAVLCCAVLCCAVLCCAVLLVIMGTFQSCQGKLCCCPTLEFTGDAQLYRATPGGMMGWAYSHFQDSAGNHVISVVAIGVPRMTKTSSDVSDRSTFRTGYTFVRFACLAQTFGPLSPAGGAESAA